MKKVIEISELPEAIKKGWILVYEGRQYATVESTASTYSEYVCSACMMMQPCGCLQPQDIDRILAKVLEAQK